MPWWGDSVEGSSPLARGLRAVGRGAGSGPRDHPRSRGVYTINTAVVQEIWGSSPLARGLHDLAHHPCFNDGIIPARAGFTPHRPGRPHGGADHPRSRGVYLEAPHNLVA